MRKEKRGNIQNIIIYKLNNKNNAIFSKVSILILYEIYSTIIYTLIIWYIICLFILQLNIKYKKPSYMIYSLLY